MAHSAQPDVSSIFQKYEEEKNKRLRADGNAQYIDLAATPFKHFGDDIWVDTSAPDPEHPALIDGSECKVLILGAGYGGLYFAVRLIEAGFSPEDIRIVDLAGGYGGTWYWNRYPGLMCGVESYIYMPLLEEMGYMPKHKYAYGPELRQHAENIADKWKLRDSTLFRSTVTDLTWDDTDKHWIVKISRKRNSGDDVKITVRAQFVYAASGILSVPKLPKIPGIENFKGESFHTSRWNYTLTGGSPTSPTLTNLTDKRVAIIGTGATAIQAVPQLAQYAKELYVIQRTPSAVDRRDNRPTDSEWWAKEHQGKKGWQRARTENFHTYTSNAAPFPEVNLVDDGWTSMPSFSALTGGPNQVTMETLSNHIQNLHGIDLVRQEKIRARVDEIVQDKATAEKLKPWYAGWCKRPCFHDEYLPSFNRPNVHLIDTEGKGVDSITEHGLVVKGVEYPVDLLIFSTGFSIASTDPASRAGLHVTGRNGLTFPKKWEEGVGTLHGVISRGFPNLFFTGPLQSAASPNFSFVIDQFAIHSAYIISETLKRAGKHSKVTVEPSFEGEEQWSMQIMAGSLIFAALIGCTPSYTNREGELAKMVNLDPATQAKMARGGVYSQGITSFVELLEKWRNEGNMQGLEVNFE